jgi:DNA repair ATPase RecN
MVEIKKEFGLSLIQFYKEFLLGTAKSVSLLAEIEKKYPEQYQTIKELKDDPKAITQLSEKMPEEVKTFLYSTIIETSTLGSRMNRLFDLTQVEKEKLSKDMCDFAERFEKKVNELAKK